MRVAINLLTDHPDSPSGAHWFWTRIIPEMAKRMTGDEEFRLVVSPRTRPMHEGYGPNVGYITFPYSNESPPKRTLSEHLLTTPKFRRERVDVFSTLLAPLLKPAPGLVVHFKTLHAYTEPGAIALPNRLYRRFSYPRTAKMADAIIINSQSLRSEIDRYLDVDPAKLRMIPEAVDHDLFRPGDRDEAAAHVAERYGVTDPFVLFVSSLWPYKNCQGLIRAFAAARRELGGRKLVIVGAGRDEEYLAGLRTLAAELGVTDDVVWVGGVPLEETVQFYRCADTFVYPSRNETFGLPILEAMAVGCPVVTSNVSAMPETAGAAALLADPLDPEDLAGAIVAACGPENERLRKAGPARAAEFSWARCAEQTLEVYREVYAGRGSKGGRR